jgi:hypothetical protein
MLTSVDAPKLAELLVEWSNVPARPQDVPQALSKGDDLPAMTTPPLPTRAVTPQADTDGPAFAAKAIIDVLDAAKSDTTVIADRPPLRPSRRGSTHPLGQLYCPASGGLGWGLPAAIRLQLGDSSRRVLGITSPRHLDFIYRRRLLRSSLARGTPRFVADDWRVDGTVGTRSRCCGGKCCSSEWVNESSRRWPDRK